MAGKDRRTYFFSNERQHYKYVPPSKSFVNRSDEASQSRKQEHVDLLARFITTYPFSSVLILTSLDSAAGTTEEHLYNPLQALIPPSLKDANAPELIQRMGNIPPYVPPTPVHPSQKEPYPPFLPCAGLTRRLLATLETENVPPHATLAYWCAEADNREDAMRYAGVVTYLLGIRESSTRAQGETDADTGIAEDQVKLVEPSSWRGLFGGTMVSGGTSATSDIYG